MSELYEHGTRERYQAGCRCGPCRQANARYEHRRRRQLTEPCGCTGAGY